MSRPQFQVAFALTLAALLVPVTASAKGARKIEIGIGATGFVNANFMGEPEEEKKLVTIEGREDAPPTKVPYAGFWGVGGGGGVQLNAMYRGFIGMELDLLYSYETGKTDVSFTDPEGNETEITVTLDQGSFHIPLLVKAAIPMKSVRPFVLIGPEFVLPGDPTVSSDPDIGYKISGLSDPYINLATGFGFEFKLPVSGVDLRIPLSFRGSFNLGKSDGLDDKIKVESVNPTTNIVKYKSFNGEWEYQAFVMLGFAWYQYVD